MDDHALAERIAKLPHQLRALQGESTVSGLFAGASDRARVAGGFDHGLVLTVRGHELTPRGCGALEHDPSDLVRRRLLRRPVLLTPHTREERWVRLGVAADDAAESLPSVLDDEALDMGNAVAGPIAPEDGVVAILVAGRLREPITRADRTLLACLAAVTAVALTRIVHKARMNEVAGELRHLSVSTDALIDEVLRAPVQVPEGDAVGAPRFPAARSATSGATAIRTILSDRESEVAALLADGLSDREIAEQLVISLHTAKDHVARVRRKLGAPNRVAAAAAYLRLMGSADGGV